MSEENESKDVNPFLRRLRDNQLEQARGALIQTICESTDRTIGGVLTALEEDDDGEGIMEDMFKRMTISELVRMAHPYVGGESAPPEGKGKGKGKKKKPVAQASDEDEDDEEDGELEDDNEFDDDGSEGEPVKGKKKKKGKKGKKGKKDKAPKNGGGESKGNGTPSTAKVLKCISKNAPGKSDAISSANIRELVGGEAPEMKEILDNLLESKSIKKTGKARGTKYYAA